MKNYLWPDIGTGRGLNRPHGGTEDVKRTHGRVENLAGETQLPDPVPPSTRTLQYICNCSKQGDYDGYGARLKNDAVHCPFVSFDLYTVANRTRL